jgi:hypothetical protein
MAQTKTKRAASNARTNSGGSGSRTRSRTRTSAGTRTSAAKRAGKSTAPDTQAGGTLGRVASKVKGPAVAGGAALAGLAAGVAISRNGRSKRGPIPNLGNRRKRISMPDVWMPNVSMPRMKLASGDSTRKALGATAKALGNTAVEVGKAGYKLGELTTEVRRVREQAAEKK